MENLKKIIHDLAKTSVEITEDHAKDYLEDYGNLKGFKNTYCEKSAEEYIESSYGSLYSHDFDDILKEGLVESEFFQDAKQDAIKAANDDRESALEDIVFDNKPLLYESMNFVMYDQLPSCEEDMKNHIEKLVDIIMDMQNNVFCDGSKS